MAIMSYIKETIISNITPSYLITLHEHLFFNMSNQCQKNFFFSYELLQCLLIYYNSMRFTIIVCAAKKVSSWVMVDLDNLQRCTQLAYKPMDPYCDLSKKSQKLTSSGSQIEIPKLHCLLHTQNLGELTLFMSRGGHSFNSMAILGTAMVLHRNAIIENIYIHIHVIRMSL